jgi:hypothetical protein
MLLVWAMLAVSFSGLIPAALADGGGDPGAGGEAVPVYAEDFENGWGQFTSRFGTMQLSNAEKHSGQYGVQVGSNVSAQGVWYKHDRLLEDWTVTAWVYDDMTDSINIIHFQETDTSTRNVNFWVGANVTAPGEANYSTRYGNTHTPTTAVRSQGWHELTIVNDFTGEMELKVYVDGVRAMTGIAFKMRTVTLGNFWGDRNTSTTRYWDDFALYDTAITMPDSGEEPGVEIPVRVPVEGKTTLGYKAETGLPAIAGSLLLALNSPDVILNDTKDMLDRTNPLIVPRAEAGGVLIPAELLANSLGAQLAWDDSARTVTISYQGHQGVLEPGDSMMLLDGSPVSLSQPAAIVDNRLYVPLKEVAEELFSREVTVKESGLIIVSPHAVELTAGEEAQILDHFDRPGQLLFVAPGGDDSHAGTLEQPFRTLEAARDRIRSLKAGAGLPDGGVTVYVRGGDYSRMEPFVLEEQDSGTEAAPIHYSGFNGETARIHGGVIIPGAAFAPVTDPLVHNRLSPEAAAHIRVADLAALGLTAGQIGDISYQGHGIAIQPSESELFVDNKPMIRARYPNQGYLKITQVIREGSVPRAGDMSGITPIFKFRDPDNRTSLWSNASDAWIYGFPKYQWADNTIGVSSIDPATLTMELAQPSYYGVDIGQGFYFLNVLEELDQPGEWYLDKENLKAYVYEEQDLSTVETAITLTDGELIDFRNVSHVVWENFDLAYTRKNAVNMSGGHHIRLEGNRIYNTGEKAIMAGNYPVADEYDVNSTDRGGRSYTIKSNDIFNIGKGAIHISGGDRQELAPGNMLVENNHIWNYARLRMEDGIKMFGVGNTISNNKIHDAPKKAIQFGGNDMVVEYNEIYDVLYSVDDMGAVYMGRDLTYQGNVVRHNLFHNITGPGHSGLGVHAVYFDDFTSYGEVYGNLMYKVQNPIKYNGGSGHKTYNNIIYKSTPNSGWYADVNNNSSNANFATGVLADNLRRAPYQSAVWQSRYPHLTAFIESNPTVPRNNWFDSNAVIQHKPIGRYYPGYGSVVSNTYETQADVGFADESSLNFNLQPDSAVYQQIPGFAPLQLDKMGLYADQYRTIGTQTPVIQPSPSNGEGGTGGNNGGDNGEGGTGGNNGGDNGEGGTGGNNGGDNGEGGTGGNNGGDNGEGGTGGNNGGDNGEGGTGGNNGGDNGEGGTGGGNPANSAASGSLPGSTGTDNGQGVSIRITNPEAGSQIVEAVISEASIRSAENKNSPVLAATIELKEFLKSNTIRIPVSSWKLLARQGLKLTVQSPLLRMEFIAALPEDGNAGSPAAQSASGTKEEWLELVIRQAGNEQAAWNRTTTNKLTPVGHAIHAAWSVQDQANMPAPMLEFAGAWSYTMAELQQIPGWDKNAGKLYLLGIGKLDEEDSAWRYTASRLDSASRQILFTGNGEGYYSLMLAAPEFADIGGHWASEAIQVMAARTVIDGFPDGQFLPDQNINRAQITAFVMRALEQVPALLPDRQGAAASGGGTAGEADGGSRFGDVQQGEWYQPYAEAAAAIGLIEGYPDGTFLPDAAVSRTEMAVILVRAAEAVGYGSALSGAEGEQLLKQYGDLADAPAWSRIYLAKAIGLKLMEGVSEDSFAPGQAATRAQASVMLMRLLERAGALGK